MNPLKSPSQGNARVFFVIGRYLGSKLQYEDRVYAPNAPWGFGFSKARQFNSITDALTALAISVKENGTTTPFIQRVTETTTPGTPTISLSRDLCAPAKGYVVITTYGVQDVVARKADRFGVMTGHGHMAEEGTWRDDLASRMYSTLDDAMKAVAKANFEDVVPFSHIARVVEESAPPTVSITTETLKFVLDDFFPQHVAR